MTELNDILECDAPCHWLRHAQQLLKDDPRSLNRIAIDHKIPSSWLRLLDNDTVKSPSVNRISYLINKLTEYRKTIE